MFPKIYWIDNYFHQQFGILSRPCSEDWLARDILGLSELGIHTVISLLTPEETRELGLLAEANYCQQHNIKFISFPIPDRGVPDSFTKAAQLAQIVSKLLDEDKKVVVHCRAGIGRSSLIIGCILVYAGIIPAQAYAMITAARGLQVPDTEEQMVWLTDFSYYLSSSSNNFKLENTN